MRGTRRRESAGMGEDLDRAVNRLPRLDSGMIHRREGSNQEPWYFSSSFFNSNMNHLMLCWGNRFGILLFPTPSGCLTPSMMSGTTVLPQKRTVPLPENEKMLYDLIWSKESLGIWTADMKRETGLTNTAVTRALKSLQAKIFIKDVVNIHNKTKKFYMAVEFEPPMEISGGSWSADGSHDFEFIMVLREQCRKHVGSLKATTVENVWQSIRDSGVFRTECMMQQIKEIMGALVLDREIQELTSLGVGEFSHIPAGRKCYMSSRAGAGST